MDARTPIPTAVLVTASYAPDLERCRLLCESIDRNVTGHNHHYLLVAGNDVSAFRQLEGSRRTVVDERDILPGWLRSFPDPLSKFRRRVWLSPFTAPLRGWHVQQLRRIAIAGHFTEDAMINCDSDVAFIRPFDTSSIWHGTNLRLYRRDDELAKEAFAEHRIWAANAGEMLGIAAPARHDYISTIVAWRRDAVMAMRERLEQVSGRHWVSAIARRRRFSECIIYGRFADEILQSEGHTHSAMELCQTFWFAPAPSEAEFREFVAEMAPEQVAVGMQSFIGADLGMVRRLVTV